MLATGTPHLEVTFYVLSIAVLAFGLAGGAWKAARALIHMLDKLDDICADVKDLHACVDRRFHEVNLRLDQIPKKP